MLTIGIALFLTGISGNFYHHYLLARLRDPVASGSCESYVAQESGAQESGDPETGKSAGEQVTRTSMKMNPFSVEGALQDKPTFEKRYRVPMGGCFPHAACAHYFFELLGWLGMAFMVQHVFGFCFFLSMLIYLGDRSVAQQQWSREKIPGYPTDRKNMIPGIW
jgi:hypothetical protein